MFGRVLEYSPVVGTEMSLKYRGRPESQIRPPCADTKSSIVSTRILGRRTVPIVPFLIPHPRPTMVLMVKRRALLGLREQARQRGHLPQEGRLVQPAARRRRLPAAAEARRHPVKRGITRDYTPFLLILQGMTLQLQGIALPPF